MLSLTTREERFLSHERDKSFRRGLLMLFSFVRKKDTALDEKGLCFLWAFISSENMKLVDATAARKKSLIPQKININVLGIFWSLLSLVSRMKIFLLFVWGLWKNIFYVEKQFRWKESGASFAKRDTQKEMLNFIRSCKYYAEMMNKVRPTNADKRKQFANLIIMCINLNAPFTPIMVQLSCCNCIHSLRTLFIAV